MRKMNVVIISLIVLLAILAVSMKIMKVYPLALNLHKPVYQAKGIAVDGFDVVAYFKENKAVKGQAHLMAETSGSRWLFSSEQNLEAFRKDPQKYLPEFGGYCTFAVSKGFTAPGNGTYWHMEGGKLYLFSNESVLKDALRQFETVQSSANKKWH